MAREGQQVIGNLLALVAANLCFLAAGLGITRAGGLWTSRSEATSWLAVAYMAGVAAVGVAAVFGLIAGLALSRWQFLLACVLLVALGLVRRSSTVADEGGTRISVEAWPIKAALAVPLALLVAESTVQALDTWDAFAMWTMKSRALVLFDGLEPAVFANSLYPHIDYPMFLPALQAIDFRAMGELDTRMIHVQSAFLLCGWLLSAARLLRGRADTWTVWAALGLAVMAPGTMTLIQEGYADIVAAMFISLAVLSAWLYLEEPRPTWALLVAVFAAAGASTKREAWTFAFGLFFVAVVVAWLRKRPIAPLLAGFALCAVTVGAWLAWLAHHGVADNEEVSIRNSLDPLFLADRTGRAWEAIVGLADYSTRPYLWLIVIPLALVVALVAARDRGSRQVALFVLAVIGLEYAALVWAFWASIAPIDWHVEHAAPRVVATPAFVGAIFLPLLVAHHHHRESRDEDAMPSAKSAFARPSGR
jgi:hypothetical protein